MRLVRQDVATPLASDEFDDFDTPALAGATKEH
jgi:hypothetical protein